MQKDNLFNLEQAVLQNQATIMQISTYFHKLQEIIGTHK